MINLKNVLLFNIDSQKSAKIKMICHRLFIGFRDVEKDEYGLKLSELLSGSKPDIMESGVDFDEEMLYIFGLTNTELNIFLSQLRARKVPVALKAIATDTNLKFTSYELYRELSAEHEAMKNGGVAHDQA